MGIMSRLAFIICLTALLVASTGTLIDKLLLTTKAAGLDTLSVAKEKLGSIRSAPLDKCQLACSTLSSLLPNEYTSSSLKNYQPLPYWSVQQSEVVPACRIDVSSAQSISTVIKTAKLNSCPFAVKSGGHASFAGGSSVQNGILINLGKLNKVSLSKDRKTASVGPGQTWYDVYQKLDPLKVSVVGGREAGVGVGGLTLGGGISYFSGRYGWACDNVRAYEVVLASGEIVTASPTSKPDLYWALRGGAGTNFGIVSQFELASFEQGNLWGGGRYYPIATNASLAKAFENFNIAAPKDEFAHLYVAFVYAEALGGYIGVSGPVYGKPEPNPPIFKELEAIPSIFDATSIANMSTLSVELNQTAYLREVFKTVTFKNSASLITQLVKIFIEETNPILDVPGLMPAFAFQPISQNIIQKMQTNGGNALGITPDRGPLMLMNLNFGWSSTSSDSRIEKATNNIITRAVALAKQQGLHDRFIYMNYASLDQDVYAGFGERNRERLRGVRTRYDPEGVFGRLWRGYFKV